MIKKLIPLFIAFILLIFSFSVSAVEFADVQPLPVGEKAYIVYRNITSGVISIMSSNDFDDSYSIIAFDGSNISFGYSDNSIGPLTFNQMIYTYNNGWSKFWVNRSNTSIFPIFDSSKSAYYNFNVQRQILYSTVDIYEGGLKVFTANAWVLDDAFTLTEPSDDSPEVSKSILTNIKNILVYIFDLPSKIKESLSSLFTGLADGISNIPQLISDKLESLFIPSDGFFSSFYNDLKTAFDERVPFISQFLGLGENILGAFNDSFTLSAPDFNVTLYGSNFKIWDWTWFETYRSKIQGVILAVIYIPWSIKMLNRLPGIIKGMPDNISFAEGVFFDNKTGEVYFDGSKKG